MASGFITSAPTRVLHMIGSSPATTVETVITFGRSRSRAPSITASRRLERVSVAELPRLALHRFLQVDHHHHAGLHRGAEERDETDPHRDREVVAKEPQQVDAAGQGEWHRQQDVGGFDRRSVGDVEQNEDDRAGRPARRPAAARARAPGSPSARSTRCSSRPAASTPRATAARASATNPPTSRPCTLSRTVASSSPFSDEIMAGPRACSMRASCPSGICSPPGAPTSTCASACGSARASGR